MDEKFETNLHKMSFRALVLLTLFCILVGIIGIAGAFIEYFPIGDPGAIFSGIVYIIIGILSILMSVMFIQELVQRKNQEITK